MSSAELLAALNTVEQDHQLVLDKVEGLKKAVSIYLEPDGLPRQVLDQLRDLYNFFSIEFENHLEEEEITLFPLLEKAAPDGATLVERLKKDHEEIRHRLGEFEKSLHIATELADHPQRMVLRDLLDYGWELWDVLHTHAHLETQVVQQCVSQALRSGGE
jgi:iron-sulfur cluster repair protein YtfE (RIC family)